MKVKMDQSIALTREAHLDATRPLAVAIARLVLEFPTIVENLKEQGLNPSWLTQGADRINEGATLILDGLQGKGAEQ